MDILRNIWKWLPTSDILSFSLTSRTNNILISKSLKDNLFFRNRLPIIYSEGFNNTLLDFKGLNGRNLSENNQIPPLTCRLLDMIYINECLEYVPQEIRMDHYPNSLIGLIRHMNEETMNEMIYFFKNQTNYIEDISEYGMNYAKEIFHNNPKLLAKYIAFGCVLNQSICAGLTLWSVDNLDLLRIFFDQLKSQRTYYHLCSIATTILSILMDRMITLMTVNKQ
jgi:hypothetical protein